MADTPDSVVRAENFFDILAMANSYADGKDIKGLDAFLGRSVRGKDQVASDRMSNRPSKTVSDAVRKNVERAQKVLDAHEANANKPQSEMTPIYASEKVVTPADASKIDGVIIREIGAKEKVASCTDLKKLVDSREEDRPSAKLPGNMHTEMSRMLRGTPVLVEASLSAEEAKTLSQLYV